MTIFTYSEAPGPHLNDQAWAAAFVLISFVLITSLLSRAPASRAAAASSSAVNRLFTRAFTARVAHVLAAARDTGAREPTHRRKGGMKTRVLSIAALVVAALVATTGALAGGRRRRPDTLSGAGATFPSR